VVAVYGYDPYGKEKKNLTRTAGGSANWDSRLRFQMAPRDPATGSYNLGPRLLNPGINRFVGADSYVGAAANMALAVDPLTGNRYLYAGANPAGLIDDGHGWGWLKKAARFGKGC
jgi:RHS repeat-associated protein